MKDRFRFRVWDNDRKYFATDSYKFFTINDGDLFVDIGGPDANPRLVDPEQFIIQQCTGLKDRAGELIYEGDLLEFANPKTPALRTVEVEWSTAGAGFMAGCMSIPLNRKLIKIVGNKFEGSKEDGTCSTSF